MKAIYLISIALLTLSGVSSCSTIKYQMINVDMTRISLAMNKEQVYAQIGKPNNIISAQRLPEGILEVLEYMRSEQNAYTDSYSPRPIWLYFLNNELIEWGPGEDWQANQALKERAIERYKIRSQQKP